MYDFAHDRGALATTTHSTTTGDCESDDGQDWTFYGVLTYQSNGTSGGQEHYAWADTNACELSLQKDTHYTNADVYYRAAVVDGSNFLWQNTAQNNLSVTTLTGTSADLKSWTADGTHNSATVDLSDTVTYKVQSSKDNVLADIVPATFDLQHDQ